MGAWPPAGEGGSHVSHVDLGGQNFEAKPNRSDHAPGAAAVGVTIFVYIRASPARPPTLPSSVITTTLQLPLIHPSIFLELLSISLVLESSFKGSSSST